MKINPDTIEKYKDIIYEKRPTSLKHPPMSIEHRAAQFAPFAALTGHKEEINETARLTEKKIEFTEDQNEKLDEKFHMILDYVGKNKTFIFTLFIKDLKKDGGAYISKEGAIKKIDLVNKYLTLDNNDKIYFQNVVNIKSDIFSDFT